MSRCDTSSSSNSSNGGDVYIDPYSIELTYSQFNIVLNNHNVEVSFDVSAAIIWQISDILGLDSDNLHNNAMKKRVINAMQFQLSFKNRIVALLEGSSVQLGDDRSGVAKTGVVLLPAVLSRILVRVKYPGVLFDAALLDAIYGGIVALVKNRRLKDSVCKG